MTGDGESENVLKAEEADEFGGEGSATRRKSGSRREYTQQHDATNVEGFCTVVV